MKTAVVTGANVGIGLAVSKFIAGLPDWHVVLACRDPAKARTATEEIRRTHPHAQVSFEPLDLFSLSSARQFPERIRRPVHGLILNAGGIDMKAKALEFTEDGFERTFQLNFLGHFLLANLMVGSMADDGRIVFVSSDLHDPAATKMGKVMKPRYGPLEDLARGEGTAAKLKPMARYGTAKMYAMMSAYELDRRLRRSSEPVTVNSWSPGVVPTTQAGRNMSPLLKLIMMSNWFVRFMGSHLSTEEEAGEALGSLLVDPRYAGVSGRYFDGFREIPSSVESRDEGKARTVFEQGLRLAGLPATS